MLADVSLRSLALGKEDRNNVRNQPVDIYDVGSVYQERKNNMNNITIIDPRVIMVLSMRESLLTAIKELIKDAPTISLAELDE